MRTHIPSRLLVLTAVGVGLVGAGAAGSLQAADPFVAGQTSTRAVASAAPTPAGPSTAPPASPGPSGCPPEPGPSSGWTTGSSTGSTTKSSPVIAPGGRSRLPGSGPTVAW